MSYNFPNQELRRSEIYTLQLLSARSGENGIRGTFVTFRRAAQAAQLFSASVHGRAGLAGAIRADTHERVGELSGVDLRLCAPIGVYAVPQRLDAARIGVEVEPPGKYAQSTRAPFQITNARTAGGSLAGHQRWDDVLSKEEIIPGQRALTM
jgi:hypothetical protein